MVDCRPWPFCESDLAAVVFLPLARSHGQDKVIVTRRRMDHEAHLH